MEPKQLDGKGLRRAVLAGADWVRRTREQVNRINVFPVADGDTGDNMALSLGSVARALHPSDDDHLGRVAGVAAEASVLGAKGNSGLILAHWFLGLKEAFGQRAHVGVEEFARAFQRASETVQASIDRPVEGTIVTVMRAAAEGALRATQRRGCDLQHLVDDSLKAAEECLARTPEMLEVLREAAVVDAGAQGFVNFLSGMRRAIHGAPPPPLDEGEIHARATHAAHEGDVSHERYCTELVLRGKHLDAERLRRRLVSRGSSLLIASSGSILKLHIHTDHPDDVMKMAARFGTIEERKVDDMRRQREERGGKSIEPLLPLDRQSTQVAILCDTAGDLPLELRRRHAIEPVPMQILFGDEVYRDGVDLDGETLYRRMLEDGPHPTTSQPSPGAFLEAFARVRSDRPGILITVSSELSGTHRAALAAATLAHQSELRVYDSRWAGVAQGMMALCAARLAERGAGVDEIVGWLDRWRTRLRGAFTVETLDYLKRGGRISLAKGMIASLIGILPVFHIHEGSLGVLSQDRGQARALARILSYFEQELPEGSRIRVGLTYSTDRRRVAILREALARRHEVVEVLELPLAAAIGVHLGPGAYGAFAMRVEDDDPLLDG